MRVCLVGRELAASLAVGREAMMCRAEKVWAGGDAGMW
jgi:hypothetical protein